MGKGASERIESMGLPEVIQKKLSEKAAGAKGFGTPSDGLNPNVYCALIKHSFVKVESFEMYYPFTLTNFLFLEKNMHFETFKKLVNALIVGL